MISSPQLYSCILWSCKLILISITDLAYPLTHMQFLLVCSSAPALTLAHPPTTVPLLPYVPVLHCPQVTDPAYSWLGLYLLMWYHLACPLLILACSLPLFISGCHPSITCSLSSSSITSIIHWCSWHSFIPTLLRAGTHGPNIGRYELVQQKSSDIRPVCIAAGLAEAGLNNKRNL